MNRRRFLKILGIASITAAASPLLSLAKENITKVLKAVKTGKYPGKIKTMNKKIIRQEGKWLG